MLNINDIVKNVVIDFVKEQKLFTALDISNEVKKSYPFYRHKEIRDNVRSLFSTEIETANYTKTPITVNLEDGSTAEALLYHPLVDSWDLDAKYDAQKRAQVAKQPGVPAQAPVQAALNVLLDPANLSVPVAGLPTLMKPTPMPKVVSTTVPAVDPAVASSRAMWDNLFKAQPSLFPRK